MSNSSYTHLSKLFLILSKNENEIEKLRQQLNSAQTFDLFQTFLVLSTDNQITAEDLSRFYFENTQKKVDNKIFENIIFFFDENKDKSFSFSEFCSFILSDKNFELRRNTHYNCCKSLFQKGLSEESVELILQILSKEIQLMKEIIEYEQTIYSTNSFFPDKIFNEIETDDSIFPSTILNVFTIGLGKDTNKFNKTDIDNVMKRIDINKDSIIDKEEFLFFMHLGKDNYQFLEDSKVNVGLDTFRKLGDDNNEEIIDTFGFKSDTPEKQQRKIPEENLIHNYENTTGSEKLNNQLQFTQELYSQEQMNQDENEEMPYNNYNFDSQNKLNCNSTRNYYPNFEDTQPFQEKNVINEFKKELYIPKDIIFNKFSPNSQRNRKDILIQNNRENNNDWYDGEVGYNDIDNINSYVPRQDCCCQCGCQCQYRCGISSTLFLRKVPKRVPEGSPRVITPKIQKFFKNLILIEQEIENKKEILSLRQDFTVDSVFSIFESKSKPNTINISNLQRGLSYFNINALENELYFFMKRFDLSHKGYLTYEEFFDIVTPFDKELRDLVESRHEVVENNYSNEMIFTTNSLIQSLFELILGYESSIEVEREELNITQEEIDRIFIVMDKGNKGYIDCKDMYKFVTEFISSNEMSFERKGCDLLYIRFDRNRNGKVEKYELENELKKCDFC